MSAPTDPPRDPDDIELVDVEQLRDWVGFVRRSLARRRWLSMAVATTVLGVTAGLYMVWPRDWQIEGTLLAQRNTVMPALGNPNRAVPLEADNPTRAASETVLRRDNLLSLIRQTDLVRQWRQSRSWPFRLKDTLQDRFRPASEEERLLSLVGYLESQLTVTTTETTVNIRIDWPDARTGYRLVDTAMQNFLEERHAMEVSTIAETITILEGHAAQLKETIDGMVEELKQNRSPPAGAPRADVPVAPRRDPAQETLRAEAAEVRVRLEGKRRAIAELEEFRRHRLAELQTELAQQRAVYADAHPAVARVLQSISALQEDSPQLAALRKDEQELMNQLAKMGVDRPEASRPGGGSAVRRQPAAGRAEEVSAEYTRTRLRFALEKYDGLVERIEGAKIELDTARAAFKYRYSVVRPPTIPWTPAKPRPLTFLVAGLLAAFGLATLVAALVDVRAGRVLEHWQISRLLELPVIGQLPRA